MRVGFDARALVSPIRSGVEHYVISLLGGFGDTPHAPEGIQIIAYTDRPKGYDTYARYSGDAPFGYSGRLPDGSLTLRVVRARRGWLRVALPWRLWRDRADLVHLPSTIVPPILPCPAVVTVHDLAWARYPETYDPADLHMQTQVVPRSIRRAAHVIAVSQSTADDLVEMLGVPASKITVTPLGVSAQFRPEGPPLASDAFPGAERLAAGYLLAVATGGPHPRKNVARLLEAYEQVRRAGPAAPLVIAGGISSPAGRQFISHAASLGLRDDVVFAGSVGESVLPSLYRGATVLAYPSLYEGFGLPILEAMASGVPVITSDRSSMKEVAGEAAVLIDPENVQDLASALKRVLSDGGLRQDLRRRGLARSREFRWERTARETAAVYRRFGREQG